MVIDETCHCGSNADQVCAGGGYHCSEGCADRCQDCDEQAAYDHAEHFGGKP